MKHIFKSFFIGESPMHTFKYLLLISCFANLYVGCKQKTPTRYRANATAVEATKGTGNGLKLDGTGFVWEKSELPICYSAREGIQFFVWKEQSTFACNKGHKDWQLVAQKKG